MRLIGPIILLVVGAIHLLPISGLLGVEYLQKLYGVTIADDNLIILMRHRAVLFGLLGALLIGAIWLPGLRLIALIAGLISVGSFIALALSSDGYNQQLANVVNVDWAALLLLSVGLILELQRRHRSNNSTS